MILVTECELSVKDAEPDERARLLNRAAEIVADLLVREHNSCAYMRITQDIDEFGRSQEYTHLSFLAVVDARVEAHFVDDLLEDELEEHRVHFELIDAQIDGVDFDEWIADDQRNFADLRVLARRDSHIHRGDSS